MRARFVFCALLLSSPLSGCGTIDLPWENAVSQPVAEVSLRGDVGQTPDGMQREDLQTPFGEPTQRGSL